MIKEEITGKEAEELSKLIDSSHPNAILYNGSWYYKESKFRVFFRILIDNIFRKKNKKENK